ncbi:putative protopine 6-monooxygenase [Rosa chinensis]|uniref:Putative protopine 6-monooxygenase n=1 Tax=Rosa chinensis TaxID=74649 RepID=A0A2P6PYF8_ROSCH|nr:putative protopine 6-monooxygenase [Rosa chinensis]
MDALIFALEGVDLGGYDADTVNKATCLNLIAGGSDPTFVTLTWAISLLLNNHHVLKKAQEELDTEIGRERTVTESDISKLVYIQAIVKETCVYTLQHHYQHHMSSIKTASWLPCPQGYTVDHKSLENLDRPSNMARAIRVQTKEISDYPQGC